MTLVSDAPLDEHTTALLRSLAPAHVAVADANDPGATLREWAQAARSSQDRLVLVDSSLRAEANALANLLDDPRVGTAVLLAHNAIDGVNSAIHIDDRGHVSDEGQLVTTAGIMVVAHDDCPAFADALEAAARGIKGTGSEHPWDLALAALATACPVDAVAAAPFCASREGMELPTRSEHDRRLHAAAGTHDDALARWAIRPASRPLTGWAVSREIPPRRLTLIGFGLGAVAATSSALPGVLGLTGAAALAANIVTGLLLITAGLFFLAGGEAVRYLRRPEVRGQRLYSLTRRTVDVLVLLGIGVSAVAADATAAVLAAIALAAVGIAGSMSSAGTSVAGLATREYWPLRWLLTAVALMAAGPAWALIAATSVAVGGAVHAFLAASLQRADTVFTVTTAQRFLSAPGVLIDAGVPVRLLSTMNIPGPRLSPRLLVAGAMAAVGLAVAASWGNPPWLLIVGASVAVFLMAQALRAPLQGSWAWTVPAVARMLEFAVVAGTASYFVGTVGAAALVAATVLLTGDVSDRWRLRRRAPAAWVPVAGLGFDGRMLAVAVLGTVWASGGGAAAIAILAALVATVWVVAAAGFWRPTDGA